MGVLQHIVVSDWQGIIVLSPSDTSDVLIHAQSLQKGEKTEFHVSSKKRRPTLERLQHTVLISQVIPTSASDSSLSLFGLVYFSCMKGIQDILHFFMKGVTSTVPKA